MMLRLMFAVLIAAPAYAEADLIAIDVMLQPDATMVAAAQSWNDRLRAEMPDGFALDASHRPHVSLVQSFIDADDLPAVLAVVEAAAGGLDLAGLTLEATGLYHIPSGDIGLQGIVVDPALPLVAVQSRIIDLLAPYRRTGGGQAAFVPDPSGQPFDPKLFTYVDTFVPDATGTHYNPHVTTGVGPLAFVKAEETEPFTRFSFGVEDIAVYHLGNYGTAAERLSSPD